MKNINKNRVSADISPAQVEDIKAAIQTVAGKMPFLITLSEEERNRLIRIGSGHKDFAQEAYGEAVVHADALPGSFSLEEMAKDINGYDSLKEIIRALEDLIAQLRDTQVLMGAEAYTAALIVYQSLDSAHRNGLEGAERAHKNLSGWFKRRPRQQKDGDNKPLQA